MLVDWVTGLCVCYLFIMCTALFYHTGVYDGLNNDVVGVVV